MAEKLRELGYPNAYALKGGMDAWEEAGYDMAPVAAQAKLGVAG